MPAGRPTTYTKAKADEICERVAQGEFLSAICIDPHMPSVAAAGAWQKAHPEFQAAYMHARKLQAETRAQEIIQISDDNTYDHRIVTDPKTGAMRVEVDGDAVQRARLRVDSRKWVAARLDPANYGDKQFVEHSGSIDINLKDMTVEDILDAISTLVSSGHLPESAQALAALEHKTDDVEEDFADLG